jgi:hypothetical protein
MSLSERYLAARRRLPQPLTQSRAEIEVIYGPKSGRLHLLAIEAITFLSTTLDAETVR